MGAGSSGSWQTLHNTFDHQNPLANCKPACRSARNACFPDAGLQVAEGVPFGGVQMESASPTDQARGSVPPNMSTMTVLVWLAGLCHPWDANNVARSRENGNWWWCQGFKGENGKGKRIKNLQ